MKKFVKFLPVALGLLALSSCSNDDLNVSKSAAVDLSNQYVLNVIEEDDAQMRATKNENYATTFDVKDVMRVYDSRLQNWDTFSFVNPNNAEKGFFAISSDVANITEKNSDGNLDYAYALFGSDKDNISYQGFMDGHAVALLKINSEIEYSEVRNSGLYKSTLPMWGTVKSQVSEKTNAKASFETTLRYLTARAKVTFENGAGLGVKKVRATSYAFTEDGDLDAFEEIVEDATEDNEHPNIESEYSDLVTSDVEEGATPIAGWFEAVLDPENKVDGVRQITDKTGSVAPAAETQIEVTIPAGDMEFNYTNIVFIPIVPGTYDLIVFEYTTDGNDWYYIGHAAGDIARGQKLEDDSWVVTAPIEAELNKTGLTTFDITKELEKLNEGNGAVTLNVNIPASGELTTVADEKNLYTIALPQLKNDFEVNIQCATNLSSADLVITEAEGVDNSKSGYKVTINFTSFAANSKKISVKAPTTDVILSGNFANVKDGNSLAIESEAKTLTLDKAMIQGSGNAGSVNIKAGNVTVSGGSKVGALKNSKEGTAVTVKDAATLLGGVTFSKAGTLKVESGTVNTVNLGDNNVAINMTGGKIGNIKKAASLTANRDITVTTSGTAEIGDVENFTQNTAGSVKVYNYTFNATYDVNTANAAAIADMSNQSKIFTALQLKSLGASSLPSSGATLYTNVVIDVKKTKNTDKDFASIVLGCNLNGESTLDTQTKVIAQISGLTKPLFDNATSNSVTSVKNLKIGTSTIAPAVDTSTGGVGALFNVVASDITIENVDVEGVTIGLDNLVATEKSGNYGLLIGKTTGEVEIKNCGVKGTLKGYYNLGGYVGNMAGGKLTISTTDGSKHLGNVNFQITTTISTTAQENAGKIGNFIGSVTGTNVELAIGDTSKGKAFGNFFSANNITEDLVKNAKPNAAGKKYVGMANYEIGLSTGSVNGDDAPFVSVGSGKFDLYGVKKTKQYNDASKKVEDANRTIANTVNIYEE